MGKPVPIPPPGFDGLSAEEKVEYVQSLWDHIVSNVEALPLADWPERLLAERLKNLDENPESSIPWSQLRAGALRRLGKSGA